MRSYTNKEIIDMKPKMEEMLKKEDLGALLQFREILKMSDSEIEKNVEKVNSLIKSVPLNYAEIMRKKYGFDLGRRYFEEDAN